jgi:hypothetical protein
MGSDANAMNTRTKRWALLVIVVGIRCDLIAAESAARADSPTSGPADLAPTFRSPVNGTDQPYRLYLPTAHDGRKVW